MAKPSPVFAGRIEALDGIRGLAIGIVLAYHFLPADSQYHSGWRRIFSATLTYGWSGVDLFFVLSGFLISGILMDTRDQGGYYSVFYKRRCFRILPLYVVLLLSFLVGRTWFAEIPAFAGTVPLWSYALMVQNIAIAVMRSWGPPFMGPTWSLAVEEQFYLLLPPAIRRIRSPKTMAALLVVLLLFPPVFRTLWTASGDSYFGPYVLLPARADALGFGIAIAVLVRNAPVWGWILMHRHRVCSLALAVLAVGFAFTARLATGSPFKKGLGYSVIDGLFALFVLTALIRHATGRRQAFLASRPLRWLGSVSYALYLLHPALLSLARWLGRGSGTSIVPRLAAFAATLLLAESSRRWFEGPILRYAHQFRYTVESRPSRSEALK